MDGLPSVSRRPTWGVVVIVLAGVAGAACATTTQHPSVFTSTTTTTAGTGRTAPPSTSTHGVSPVPAGSYALAVTPDCGEVSVNGAKVVVGGSTTSVVLQPSGEAAHGTVTAQGGGFHLHAANGTALTLDLTGTVEHGVLHGTGQSGGIHPGGQTGWVCHFAFTASLQTSPTVTPTTGSTAMTLVPPSSVADFFSPSMNIGCELDYGRAGVPDAAYCQTFLPPQSVTMSTDGSYKTCTGNDCVGNPGINTPTLAYGQATQVGPFLCVSAPTGVTCTVSGRGFEIARSGITPVGG